MKAGKACVDCLPSKRSCCSNLTVPLVDTQHSQVNGPSTLASPGPADPVSILEDSEGPQLVPTNESLPDLPSSQQQSVPRILDGPDEGCFPCTSALPTFVPMAGPMFTWGVLDSSKLMELLDTAYCETVHWRLNCFKVPQGSAGKAFVNELARLFHAFATGSALESVALKAATVLPLLLLQKPHQKSKQKDHISCLEQRMRLWEDGEFLELLEEGRTIQGRLRKSHSHRHDDDDHLARRFANFMFQGKTHAALQLLSDKGKGSVLHLDSPISTKDSEHCTVKDVLKSKHPPGLPADPDVVIPEVPPDVHPVVFDPIDASLIRSISLRTRGAAGPSGLDAYAWRRLCTSFKSASQALCHSLALTAKRLCTVLVDPGSISSLLACRLIALDKNPGVRPIGIGDTARRIIAKAVLAVTRPDVQDAAGSVQLCAGQIAGVEAAVHAVRDCFGQDDTEAALLVDASNAFNSLNRSVALQNIRHVCPTISTILINTYRAPTDLFIDGECLLSQEGTTQGDPLAMPMYAVATIPLIKKLPDSVTQVWYADDATALGSVSCLREWWDALARVGPLYGYYSNAAKTWLVAKESCHADAISAFEGTNVNVTCIGRPHLGAPLGTLEYANNFVSEKVDQWAGDLRLLSAIAITQPHAAFAAYSHGLYSKWSFLSRTTPQIHGLFETLETIIRAEFIPSLTGQPPPSDSNRGLFALPARLGGLGIRNPVTTADLEFSASREVCGPLVKEVLVQSYDYPYECLVDQSTAKTAVRKLRLEQASDAVEDLKAHLSTSSRRAMELASEKGASNWLTSLPIEEFGFCLHKGAFKDALALRYGWLPSNIPLHCVCGSSFTVEHVLSCPRGGFPIIRHNEIRDVTATMLTEVCHDVLVEPDLQPLSGEVLARASSIRTDGARLDIAVNGLWGGRFERSFLDVRVFNPHAPSNRNSTISSCYRKHELEKKRAYEQRLLEVEHSSFTPLVLSATGGMARQATILYKRLASLLADKWDQPYSSTLCWVRSRLAFSLLRSAIQCIRGARSSVGHAIKSIPPIDLVNAEAQLRLP